MSRSAMGLLVRATRRSVEMGIWRRMLAILPASRQVARTGGTLRRLRASTSRRKKSAPSLSAARHQPAR